MSIIIPANSAASGGFEVDNSLRFDKESSAYLNKTLGTPTLATKSTVSLWFKQTRLGSPSQGLIFAGGNSGGLNLNTTNLLQLFNAGGALRPNRVFRDLSAWHHVVVATDTTLNTADDRLKMYINGVQETSFQARTNPSQNAASSLGSATAHVIGCNNDPANYSSGYMSECVFIDGTALDPTSFGEFDEDSGIWKPKSVSGLTFGNNGFYLKFGNSGALGTDSSGAGNTFAVNNLDSTNQSTDTCTNNFCILNPLMAGTASLTYTEGNLKIVFGASGTWYFTTSTIAAIQGKWYCEVKIDAVGGETSVGIIPMETVALQQNSPSDYMGKESNSIGYVNNGQLYKTNSVQQSTSSYTTNDIIGIAFNLDGNSIQFYKNGSSVGNAIALTSGLNYVVGVSGYNSSTQSVNFGSPSYAISSGNTDGNDHGNFEYSVPSGHLALCTKNLSEVDS